MKVSILIFILFFTVANMTHGQDAKFTVEVSTDTVLSGNYFELKFILENTDGKFEAPDLSVFDLVSGPNTSSSFSMINGEVTQSASYTYYLKPPDIGNYTIPPAFVQKGEMILETPPIDIMTVPNPDGIIQQPHGPSKSFREVFPKQKQEKESKPKRPSRKF